MATLPQTDGRTQTPALAVEVKNITRKFGALTAVDGVSFDVKSGEIFGLLGPNGAGKSTLIRMLTTLVPPTEGTATVAGYDVVRDPNEVRNRIGVIPQNVTSDPDLTCAENLFIHARLYGMPKAQRKKIAGEMLEAVGLADRAGSFARTLSGGMRRRLEIARGLVNQPEILFLDEPTTGLDPVSRMSVWEMISSLRTQRGLTMFMTTHYMDEADRLCDRLAIVDHGKIVVLDTPTALKLSVPGASMIEVQFQPDIPGGAAALEALPGVASVRSQGAAFYRIASNRGPATATELVELARAHNLELNRLGVQSTSLDDVFLHVTGHGLTEAAAEPAAGQAGKKKGGRA